MPHRIRNKIDLCGNCGKPTTGILCGDCQHEYMATKPDTRDSIQLAIIRVTGWEFTPGENS